MERKSESTAVLKIKNLTLKHLAYSLGFEHTYSTASSKGSDDYYSSKKIIFR